MSEIASLLIIFFKSFSFERDEETKFSYFSFSFSPLICTKQKLQKDLASAEVMEFLVCLRFPSCVFG